MGKLLCVSIDEPLSPGIPFSQQFILYQMWTTYIIFKTFEEYLWELKHAETNGQTDWMQKFLTFFKNVNNV